MRFKIVHGGTIDTSTPQEVASIIADALSSQETEQYTKQNGVVALDGTGAGSAVLDVSPQYDWIVERISVSSAANATVTLYENQVSNTDLLEVIAIGTSGLYSDGFANKIHVPAGSQLVISVSAGAANGSATFRLQIKLLHRKQGK